MLVAGGDALDRYSPENLKGLAVIDFDSMSESRLGGKHGLAISFTGACRRLLARAGIAEMQLNCKDVDAQNRPSLTYLGELRTLF